MHSSISEYKSTDKSVTFPHTFSQHNRNNYSVFIYNIVDVEYCTPIKAPTFLSIDKMK